MKPLRPFYAAVASHCIATYAMLAVVAFTDPPKTLGHSDFDGQDAVVLVLMPLLSWYMLLEAIQRSGNFPLHAVAVWATYVPTFLATYYFVRWRRVPRATERSKCTCGYDLSAVADWCPKCGQKSAETQRRVRFSARGTRKPSACAKAHPTKILLAGGHAITFTIMSFYRRRHVAGGTYFFTVVTENRSPILCGDDARPILHEAIRDCAEKRPFKPLAMVLLPDHLHAIWEMPPDDDDYSTRWAAIKAAFSHAWLSAGGSEQPRTHSRVATRRRGVWQRRFWEHRVRDHDDFERHLNYIHYNPVKHGLASCPHSWQWSTFSRWVSKNVYEPSWCCGCDGRKFEPPSFDGMEELEME